MVLEQKDPPALLIQKLKKMRKPGGFLQWDQLDCVNMHVTGSKRCLMLMEDTTPSPPPVFSAVGPFLGPNL
jgi:hypothetical protein